MAEEKKLRGKRNQAQVENNEKEKVEVDLQDELNKANIEKQQMADMLKQMQEQMALLQEKLNNNSNNVVINQNDNLTRTVKVISMLPHTLNLSTQPLGRGKVYTFENFSESKNIKFSDMQDILVNYIGMFEKGYAILKNKKDYEDLGIGYIYDDVMSQETMTELTTLTKPNCINIILDMEEDMQEIVSEIIANNIVNGVSYDYNKIKQLEDGGIIINELVELINASKE